MINWRRDLDPSIKSHIEDVIKESFKYRKDYSKSKSPNRAQLWCAIGILAKQNFDLNLRLKHLEEALQNGFGKKRKNEMIRAVMNSLERF